MDKFKNVALSLAVIAGVTGLLFGATQAGWTDTATNEGNTFASGAVEIELEGAGEAQATSFFHAKDMMPSDSQEAQILIGNRSTGPVSFEVELANPVYGGGSPGLDQKLIVEIQQIGDPNDVDRDLWIDNFTGEGAYTLWTEGDLDNKVIEFGQLTLREWLDGTKTIGSGEFNLPAEYAGVYDFVVKLADNAGNEYQNKTFTVDLLVTATSVN